MTTGTIFSEDRKYRYTLRREINALGEGTCGFVMLNPSTADETKDDPTIRRCISFARSWGYAALEILNIFALRSTDPSVLKDSDDPIGILNDYYIALTVDKCDRVVLAWGAHGYLHGRGPQVAHLISENKQTYYLHCSHSPNGLTKGGQPMHPLYLAKDTTLAVFSPQMRAGMVQRSAPFISLRWRTDEEITEAVRKVQRNFPQE